MRHRQSIDRVAIIGGSTTGLLCAAALSGHGRSVTIVERDRFPDAPAPRAGVPQSPQTHVLLARGLSAAEQLLPGLRDDLIAAGAVPFNGGDLAMLSPEGWYPEGMHGLSLLTATRPLIEQVVRGRVLALPGVRTTTGHRVTDLRRAAPWSLDISDGSSLEADLVVDASGRSSRLPVWLEALGVSVPAPLGVDARAGYATRMYRADPSVLEGCPGILISASPETLRGGLALRAEQDHWMLTVVGFGDARPTRDPHEFERFLRALPDPCLSELVSASTPVGEIHIHRQTANLRRRYDRVTTWPDGLVAVGDALCAFDPVYGQGITVGALQALALRSATTLRGGRLQRRIGSQADIAWAIACSADRAMPTSDKRQSATERALAAWSARLTRLALAGHPRAFDTTIRVYNLDASPATMFHPALVGAVLGSRLSTRPLPAHRPATRRPQVLDRLSGMSARERPLRDAL